MAVAKAKFGYLLYSDMLSKITDGKLDEYDICYTKDTNECYIISETKTPIAIRSRVKTFTSVASAEIELNSAIDTYEGQVVAVKYKNKFRAYIVDKNDDTFYVSPLDEARDTIDYDTLGNKPIVNLKGTLSEPIIIGVLSAGVYRISGQYIFTPNDQNTNLSMNDLLFVVDGKGNAKKITSKTIVNYTISGNAVTEDSYVTEEYIKSQGFATKNYVDNKIAALDVVTRSDLSTYVTNVVDENVNRKVDATIERIVDEVSTNVTQSTATESDITNLFTI